MMITQFKYNENELQVCVVIHQTKTAQFTNYKPSIIYSEIHDLLMLLGYFS
jgi:hypothetical protein